MEHLLPALAILFCTTATAQYATPDRAEAPLRVPHHPARPAVDTRVRHDGNQGSARGNAPVNDNCTDAIALTVHPNGTCPGTSTAGDNTDATYNTDEPSCDVTNSLIQDVWYTFTTDAEYSAIITLTPGTGMTDWALGIYDGCGGGALYCIGQPTGANVFPLLPTTTYWLSVWSNNDYGTAGPFELCIEAPPAPPANDLCSSAVPQSMGVGDSWAFAGDATGAANTENVAFNSVWHAITLTEPADLTIDFCGSDAYDLWGDFYRTIYFTCPPNYVDRVWAGSYDITSCTDGRLTLCYARLAAGTYYLPVAQPIEPGDGYIMNVRADAFGSNVPANDECDGAIPISIGALCSPVNYLPQCPTQSLPAIDCGVPDANANDDVWYSFTAPDNLVTLAVFAHTYGYSPVIDVYSGTCGALQPFDCVDAAGMDSTAQLTLIGLDPGATYHFRVYNGYGTTPLDNASYELCAVEGDEVIIGMEENTHCESGGIFPNPTNGDFSVHVDPRATEVSIIIMDASGRTVQQETSIHTSGGSVRLELSTDTSSGIYLVRMDDGFNIQEHRLVVHP